MNFSNLTSISGIETVASFGLVVLSISIVISAIRLRKGPTLADRVLALDLMTTIIMGIIAMYALFSNEKVYVDVVIIFALVAFISTVVYARHIERDARRDDRFEGGEES
ncbi:cation:proton antiporter [bacterium]|nr:cation:proton antiporter [bacterium]